MLERFTVKKFPEFTRIQFLHSNALIQWMNQQCMTIDECVPAVLADNLMGFNKNGKQIFIYEIGGDPLTWPIMTAYIYDSYNEHAWDKWNKLVDEYSEWIEKGE